MQMRRTGIFVFIWVLFLFSACAKEHERARTWVDISRIYDEIATDTKNQRTTLEDEEKKKLVEKGEKVKTLSVGEEGKNPFLKEVVRKEETITAAVEGEGILLNFDNAEIYEVIQSIAEILNMNYIIDPQVRGVVNIRSGKKIPMSQLYLVFQKILHINGLDIRSEGEYRYIYVAKQPVAHFIRSPEELGDLKDSPKMIMQIVPVMHLSATEARRMVESYLSDHGIMYELPTHNILIIVDFESKVLDCVTILSQLDISPMSNLKVKLVRIEHAPLFDLRDELDEVMQAMRINQGDYSGISVVALERVNSLLLVGNNEHLIQTVIKWIDELDRAQTEGGDTIYVYNVRNSVASELAELVSSLIGQGAGTSAKKDARKVSPRTTPSRTRTPQQNVTPGMENVGAPMAQPAARSFQAGGDSSGMQFAGEPLLISDDSRNVILIRALPPDYNRILKILERLDNIPRQVLIETLVAEVKLTDSLELGIDWAINKKRLGTLSGENYFQSIISDLSGIGDAAPADGSAFIYKIFSNNNEVQAVLNALAENSDFTVLASPHVLVLNNETATVNVGDEVPIVTAETTTTSSTVVTDNNNITNPINRSIQYKDTGFILTVTPRINSNGMITLEIEQEKSDAVKTTVSGIDSPTISKKQVKTKLAVRNGQSILLGGLIEKRTNQTETGVPFFKDIPALGYLFKKQSESVNKTELIISITPYVIESEDVLDQYIKSFKDHIRSLKTDLLNKKGERRNNTEETSLVN